MAKPAPSITLAEFAADWAVTIRAVTGWIQEGMPHRETKHGRRIVRAEANPWLLERAKESARRPEDGEKVSELTRKTRAEADLKELELRERLGELIPMDLHLERVEGIIAGFAAVASGRLARFERDIVQAGTPGAARVLTQEIHRALLEGAQAYADQVEVEAGELATAEAEEPQAA